MSLGWLFMATKPSITPSQPANREEEVMRETAKEDVYSMGSQQTVPWGEEESVLTFHHFLPFLPR